MESFQVDELEQLDDMLTQGGSKWRVVGRGESFQLEQRVDDGVQATAEEVMSASDPAAHYLREAWHATYSRDPDPSEAYRDAVRAVEAAAKPIVTPDDPVPTLGKMIAALRDAPGKWTFAVIAPDPLGVETCRHLMELLWKGQTDRHGGGEEEEPLEVTSEESEAALHAATTLVHWFRSGAIRRAET